jgi:hypothetical protein
MTRQSDKNVHMRKLACAFLVSLGRIFLLLASIYLWILMPIVQVILSRTFGRQVGETVAIQLGTLGLVDALIIDDVQSMAYYRETLSPLIAFSVAFLVMIWVRPPAKSLQQFIIYFVIFCAVVAKWTAQGFFPLFSCLAAFSGIIVARLACKNTGGAHI